MVAIRQRKMLENGWSRDASDFKVDKKLVDNGCDEALNALTEVMNEIETMIKLD